MPMRRLTDAVLSTDPRQRLRLAQAVLAMGLMAAGLVAMNYFAWAGIAPARPVLWWTAVALAGMAVFFMLIRSGWSRGLRDPSMTVPQMLFAIACSAAAYALLGAGRGGVFPIVMVILMFGMFVVSPPQMRGVSVYAVGVFGLTMAVMAWRRPDSYPARVELGHFLMVATMMPGMSILAGRLSSLRERARLQRTALTQALVRIRELATRDELTGLINQRHMLELMEQEHQRCIRSGQTFCIGVLDIDHLAGVNERLGRDAGDALLRGLALESARHVRVSDVLSRWDGGRFVLLLPDTRIALARGSFERLHQCASGVRAAGAVGAQLTLSGGLSEHHAGETVVQTLERARAAMHDARAQGRARVVLA